MLTAMDLMDLETVPTSYPLTDTDLDAASDGTVDIMEALFEALASGERFRIVERGGELHLVDAHLQ